MNYYEILGVPRNADQNLIKATYSALMKIYHPDVFQGDKNFATDKVIKIKESYSVLSNNKKRMNYDKELDESLKSQDTESTDDFQNNSSSPESELYQTLIKSEWEHAVTFYPELKRSYEELVRFSPQLAYLYQILLVENKNFGNYATVRKELKANFLTTKFGKNQKLNQLVGCLIENGHRHVAIEIRNDLKRLGASSLERILELKAKNYGTICSNYRAEFSSLGVTVQRTEKELKQEKKQKKQFHWVFWGGMGFYITLIVFIIYQVK